MRTRFLAMSLGLSACAAPAVLAQHAGDIGIGVVDNHIATGEYVSGVFQPGDRVYGVTLGSLFPSYASDPGFDSLPAVFPVPSTISFNILAALRKWEGASFGNLIPPERIQVGFGPVTPVLTPLTDVVTPGFALQVGSNGEWHRHLEYTLLTPASDGLYLMKMNLAGNAATTQASLPFWLVFNQNRPQTELDAAVAWVNANLIAHICAADINNSGTVSVQDIFDFLSLYFANDPRADFNHSGATSIQDIFDFLGAYFTGC